MPQGHPSSSPPQLRPGLHNDRIGAFSPRTPKSPEFGPEVRSLCLQGFVSSHRVSTLSCHWPSPAPDPPSTSLTSLSPEDCQRPQWHT
ncbi:hypothetical protein MHYP_G00228750 [Metynnis hypsauchen]